MCKWLLVLVLTQGVNTNSKVTHFKAGVGSHVVCCISRSSNLAYPIWCTPIVNSTLASWVRREVDVITGTPGIKK
jgi:hypothetical protein